MVCHAKMGQQIRQIQNQESGFESQNELSEWK